MSFLIDKIKREMKDLMLERDCINAKILVLDKMLEGEISHD